VALQSSVCTLQSALRTGKVFNVAFCFSCLPWPTSRHPMPLKSTSVDRRQASTLHGGAESGQRHSGGLRAAGTKHTVVIVTVLSHSHSHRGVRGPHSAVRRVRSPSALVSGDWTVPAVKQEPRKKTSSRGEQIPPAVPFHCDKNMVFFPLKAHACHDVLHFPPKGHELCFKRK